MKLKIRKSTVRKAVIRTKNKVKIRKKISGTGERPRLAVFRSGKHVYAQLIDDTKGVTIVSASTLDGKVDGHGGNSDSAKAIGKQIAAKALAKDLKNVVFDRSGYVYHGRVKALAEGAREGGLVF